MKFACSVSRSTLLLALGVASATGALAQSAPVIELDAITVTGTKREQDPLKVDGSIAVATPEDLAQRNVRSIDRLDRVFPDVSISQRSSRVYNNVTIRGQSSIDFYNPTVQVLVDGLPQDQAVFSQRFSPRMSQVELLYGPQSTLYGRNAIGGVVNITTEKPGNEVKAGGSLGVSRFGPDGDLWFSTPLIKDVLYGDVAFSGERSRSEYRSMATGRVLDPTEDLYGRVRLRYAPTGSPWDVMLSASHNRVSSAEEQFVPGAFRKQRLAFPVPSHYQLDTTSLGLSAAYDLGFGTITSLTGYQDRKLDRTIFGSYTPEDQRTFSQELRLASKPGQGRPIDYVVGAYYQNLDFERRVPAANQISRQRIDSFALFGEATWHVTDRFDITPGVRFDYEKVQADAIGTISLSGEKSFNAVSPKLAFGYQLSEQLRAFALYSSGYKPGGFTRNVSPANIAFTYDPQTTHNFEVGLKGRILDERLTFSASAYYNITNDYQLFVGVQPNQYLQNAGEVEAKGVDLRLEARPVEALLIQAGIAFNDTRFTKYNNPATPGVSLKDNKVPYAPPVTANLNVAYTIALGAGWGTLTPHAGMSYVGKSYFDETNTLGQKAYALFDAGLTWAPRPDLKAEAYVNNIADRSYAVYGFNGGPGLGELYQLGRGREVGLRLRAQF